MPGDRAPSRRRLIIEVAFAYVAAWAVGIGFGLLIDGTSDWDVGPAWERSVLTAFHGRPLPWLLDQLMLWIPYVGTNLTMLPLMLGVGLWLWRWKGRPLLAMHLLVVAIGSLSLNPTMKYLLDRDRPKLYPPRGLYDWASYPSGHAILTTALYFTVALVLWRERGWRWPFVVAPIVVLVTCYSRLYLSVHWPTDLLGGLLIGVTWLVLTWRAFGPFYPAAPRLNPPVRG